LGQTSCFPGLAQNDTNLEIGIANLMIFCEFRGAFSAILNIPFDITHGFFLLAK
jgi:hypothetical protein